MDTMTIASSREDAQAAEAVEEHHAALAGALAAHVARVAAATRAGEGYVEARDRLVAWSREELVPHALAEEGTLYAAAGKTVEAKLLVEAMLAEHQVIVGLVDRLADADDPVTGTGAASALQTLFETHLAKENEQVLPLLVAAADVSVAQLLHGMHELLGPQDHGHDDSQAEAQAAPAAGSCACGGHDEGVPELDVRVVPHSIRHATIFGALDAVRPGESLILVADHRPMPLLAQLEQREPGGFALEWVEDGPQVWRLRLERTLRV